MNSPASHRVTVGASVIRYPSRTRAATAAAARYGGRSGSRRGHPLATLEVGDDAGEEVAHLLRREVAIEQTVTRDGNRRRLLRHDQHCGVGLLREAQRGAVPGAEGLVAHLELCERQDTARADDLVAADQ